MPPGRAGILEDGGTVTQETRLYDPDRDETRPMRSKETATDYRYFPEPDLLPIQIDDAYINQVREAGARISLIGDGDIQAAISLLAAFLEVAHEGSYEL